MSKNYDEYESMHKETLAKHSRRLNTNREKAEAYEKNFQDMMVKALKSPETRRALQEEVLQRMKNAGIEPANPLLRPGDPSFGGEATDFTGYDDGISNQFEDDEDF